MARSSIRPSGARMMRGSSVRLKVLELTPEGAANASWGAGWANYTSARFEARIAKAKALGANACTIVTLGTPAASYPSAALMDYYMGDYCALLRKYGMKHYAKLAGGVGEFTDGTTSGRNSAVTVLVQTYQNLMKHGSDLVVGVDVCNEINFSQPSSWSSEASRNSDLSYLLAAVRSVEPTVPVTFSAYCNSAGDANSIVGPYVRLQATLGCDFHDCHAYFGKAGNTGLSANDAPSPSQFANLEAQPWFIGRHFSGECGILTDGNNSDAAITAWIGGMSACAQRPLAHGGVMFGDSNFTSPAENGSFGIVGKAAAEAAFAAWPGAQL